MHTLFNLLAHFFMCSMNVLCHFFRLLHSVIDGLSNLTFKIVTSTFVFHSPFTFKVVWPMWWLMTIWIVPSTNTTLNTIEACNHFIKTPHQMIHHWTTFVTGWFVIVHLLQFSISESWPTTFRWPISLSL